MKKDRDFAKILSNDQSWLTFLDECEKDERQISHYNAHCPAETLEECDEESVTMVYPIVGLLPEEERLLAHQLSFFDDVYGQEVLFSRNMDPTRTRVCIPMTDLQVPLVIPPGKRELDFLPARLRVKEPPPKPPVFPEICSICSQKLNPDLRYRLVSKIDGTEKAFCECQACGSLFCVLESRTIVFSRSNVIHHGS